MVCGECSRIDDELIDNSSGEVRSPRTFGNCRKRYGEPVKLFGRMSERGMKMMDGKDEKDEGCYQCVADTRSDQKNDVSVRAKTMFRTRGQCAGGRHSIPGDPTIPQNISQN